VGGADGAADVTDGVEVHRAVAGAGVVGKGVEVLQGGVSGSRAALSGGRRGRWQAQRSSFPDENVFIGY
jgi:hypothetical protein